LVWAIRRLTARAAAALNKPGDLFDERRKLMEAWVASWNAKKRKNFASQAQVVNREKAQKFCSQAQDLTAAEIGLFVFLHSAASARPALAQVNMSWELL